MMNFTRIRFSEEASDELKRMKGKTGLTPNILCRIGFCLSLNDPAMPNPEDYGTTGDKEIDRKVLLGSYDKLFVALLTERCRNDDIDEAAIFDHFKAHMNRGVLLLAKRVGNIKDLAQLVPAA